MDDRYTRTRMLIGEAALARLHEAKVLVFGVGGVGGYVCEALARAGVGYLHIVDKDEIDVTNLNRQIIATCETIGRPKVAVMQERLLQIAPDMTVEATQCFYLPQTRAQFDFSRYDYIVDAIDNVTAKVDILCRARQANIPAISSMGTGNKIDPTRFEIADIRETSICPLARAVRRALREKGITEGIKVVYSREEPYRTGDRTPASISFVPPVAGLLLASEVIKDLGQIR